MGSWLFRAWHIWRGEPLLCVYMVIYEVETGPNEIRCLPRETADQRPQCFVLLRWIMYGVVAMQGFAVRVLINVVGISSIKTWVDVSQLVLLLLNGFRYGQYIYWFEHIKSALRSAIVEFDSFCVILRWFGFAFSTTEWCFIFNLHLLVLRAELLM